MVFQIDRQLVVTFCASLKTCAEWTLEGWQLNIWQQLEKSQAIFFISKSNKQRAIPTARNHFRRFPSHENLAGSQHQNLCLNEGWEMGVVCLFGEVLIGLGFFGGGGFFYNSTYSSKYSREKKPIIKVEDLSGWQGFWLVSSFPPFQPHLSCAFNFRVHIFALYWLLT